jgi:ketosteroid isomerase-like protein
MKSFFLTVFSLFFILTSVQISAQDNETSLKEKLQKMNDDIVKAQLAEDYDMLLSYYTDDAISLPSYSQMMRGKDEIQKAMMKDKDSFKINEFNLTTLEAFESGDMVYEIGKYNMKMTMKGMDNPVADEGKYLTVYQKQDDGSLKIKAEIWNTDMNPWAMMGKQGGEQEEEEE